MLCPQLKFRKCMNLVKMRKPAQPPQPLLEVRQGDHWIHSLTKAAAEADTVPGYVRYYSGDCPLTSVHSGSRTRVPVTLSSEQLYRNTFSQKTKPLGVLKKENNPLCITIILLFLNTFINYSQQKQTFLSCVLHAKLFKELAGCCHLQAPRSDLK